MAMPRKSFTTAKGIELPLLNLKGKEYLQVMHRVQWFRSENPEGIIKTQLTEQSGEGKDRAYVFRSEIYITTDKGPLLIASGYKRETVGDFPDALEKAESGSIGRALALCGYGTQFAADEFEEGNRLADSPAPVLEKSGTLVVKADSIDYSGTASTVGHGGSTGSVSVLNNGSGSKRTTFRKNVTAQTAASESDDI